MSRDRHGLEVCDNNHEPIAFSALLDCPVCHPDDLDDPVHEAYDDLLSDYNAAENTVASAHDAVVMFIHEMENLLGLPKNAIAAMDHSESDFVKTSTPSIWDTFTELKAIRAQIIERLRELDTEVEDVLADSSLFPSHDDREQLTR